MKITDSAAQIILEIMKKKRLDPKEFVFEFHLLENGGVGIGFTKDRQGLAIKHGELTIMIGHGVDMGDTVVDYGEIDGRMGLIFLEKK